MKAFIYAYQVNDTTYYAEGYNEKDVRSKLEEKLNLQKDSLSKGKRPDFNKELKRIWNPKDKKFYLTLTKVDTTNEKKLADIKAKKNALYELELLLKEDKRFLSGVNEPTIANMSMKAKKVSGFDFSMYNNTGYEMCYNNPDGDVDDVYRFKKLTDAYWHVRKNLIETEQSNDAYKKNPTITNIEICDSFIAGFGNPTETSKSKKSDMTFPMSLRYKNTL